MDNKTKETVWKLLHRKLYTEDQDGGVNVIFNTDFAKKVWKVIAKVWSEWTNTMLHCDRKQILATQDSSQSRSEGNYLRCLTIRELYRAHCNETLNKTTKSLTKSIKKIRKNLMLTLEVALSCCPRAVKNLKLGGIWIDANSRGKMSSRKLAIK